MTLPVVEGQRAGPGPADRQGHANIDSIPRQMERAAARTAKSRTDSHEGSDKASAGTGCPSSYR
jgi:hypothetical protein